MRYEARITAYDMLDEVCVVSVLWSFQGLRRDPEEPVLRTSVQVQGTGESDPRRWLRDALVALAETL